MEHTALDDGTVDRASKTVLATLANARNLADDPEIVALIEHGTSPQIRQMVAVLRDTQPPEVDQLAAEEQRLREQADPATALAYAALAETSALAEPLIDGETGEILADGRPEILGSPAMDESRTTGTPPPWTCKRPRTNVTASGTVSYTHLRAPRDRQKSRMPSSA